MTHLQIIKRNTLLFLVSLPLYLLAVNPSISNIGFENGFTGWTGKTWIYTTSAPNKNTQPAQVALPNDPRIVLMSTPNEYDDCTGSKLKTIPDGYKYSARLGAYKDSHTNNINGRDQSLEYTLKVDSSNELLTIKFALVLEVGYSNNKAHSESEQPRFTITLLDDDGNSIPKLCSSYNETSLTIDKAQNSVAPDGQPIVWRDWKAVSANLKQMEGKNVTIKFTTMDCTPGGHFGYAYIVVDTQPLYITTKYCSGNDDAVLTAPEGFASYTWKNEGKVVSTDYQCKIPNAKEGDQYSCVFMTESQCYDSLSTTIKRIQPIAKFDFSTIDCTSSSNTVQFTSNCVADALHPSDAGTFLSYQWDFGEGGTSTSTNPSYTFTTSGWQKINLKVTSYPSTCTASKDTLLETFYPPLIGIKGDATYCPDKTTTLRGYGADHYQWIQPDGSQTGMQDTLAIGAPGGKVGLIGYARNEMCKTQKYILVSEDPAWLLNITGNPFFCIGDSTTLVASGDGISYLWNGQKNPGPSITLHQPGDYTVTATNQRGCRQTQPVTVQEIPLPAVLFKVEPAIINTKYNQVTCSITPGNDIDYTWAMGDNLNENGSTVTHAYAGSGNIGKYTITLNAKNSRYGCADSSTQSIIMQPFVPNVFTPNGDTHNDYFMPKYAVDIFDREGILVYQGTKDSNGWDGTYKGLRAEPDTYFYILHYVDYKGIEQTTKGSVTLVR